MANVWSWYRIYFLPFSGCFTLLLVLWRVLTRSRGCCGGPWWGTWTLPSSLSSGQSHPLSNRGSPPSNMSWKQVAYNSHQILLLNNTSTWCQSFVFRIHDKSGEGAFFGCALQRIQHLLDPLHLVRLQNPRGFQKRKIAQWIRSGNYHEGMTKNMTIGQKFQSFWEKLEISYSIFFHVKS